MVKDKKAIKRDILNKFRMITAEGKYVLPSKWLKSDYFRELDAEEKKIFKKAVQELVSMGLVEKIQGSELKLKLTGKGANLII